MLNTRLHPHATAGYALHLLPTIWPGWSHSVSSVGTAHAAICPPQLRLRSEPQTKITQLDRVEFVIARHRFISHPRSWVLRTSSTGRNRLASVYTFHSDTMGAFEVSLKDMFYSDAAVQIYSLCCTVGSKHSYFEKPTNFSSQCALEPVSYTFWRRYCSGWREANDADCTLGQRTLWSAISMLLPSTSAVAVLYSKVCCFAYVAHV
jgi:hypothetical protein